MLFSGAVFGLHLCPYLLETDFSRRKDHYGVALNEQGQLTYQAWIKTATNQEEVALEPLPLGLITGKADLSTGLSRVAGRGQNSIDDEYEMLSGKQKKYHNFANELALTFANDQQKQLVVRLRVYDDGLAFRYELPAGEAGEVTVVEETTGSAIPTGSKSWIP